MASPCIRTGTRSSGPEGKDAAGRPYRRNSRTSPSASSKITLCSPVERTLAAPKIGRFIVSPGFTVAGSTMIEARGSTSTARWGARIGTSAGGGVVSSRIGFEQLSQWPQCSQSNCSPKYSRIAFQRQSAVWA